MDLYQPIAKHVFSPLYAWKNGSRHLRYLEEYERSQYLPLHQVTELQWEAVRKVVRHAYDNCPFYTEKYSQTGFTPDDLRTPRHFKQLPMLAKSEIQQNAEKMLARNIPRSQMIENFTGGSTGSPLRLFLTSDRRESRTAGMIRHDRWAGLDIGDKLACVWGATVDNTGRDRLKTRVRNLLLDRALYLDASLLTRDRMRGFVKRLQKYRPRVILAYANAVTLLARYLEETGMSETIAPQSIISSAEVLTPENRHLVETVFQCRVFNRYGCREASVLASECEQHQSMHINAESVYLEFVRDGIPVKPGELGEILLTDLRNDAMPLIRYRIGDAGISQEGTCACGRGLPLMLMAAGRTTDFLVSQDGGLISGIVLATYVITKVRGVRQVQFYQDSIGKVAIRMVRDPDFHESALTVLRGLLADYLGKETAIDFEFPDQIPVESSGKFRFTISTLDPLDQIV